MSDALLLPTPRFNPTMARTTITFGLLLFGLSMGGLLVAADKLPSMFIPMIYGTFLLFFGIVGLNPHRRRNAIRFSAITSVIGLLLTGLLTFKLMGPELSQNEVNQTACGMVATTAVMSLVYLTFYVSLAVRDRKAQASKA